jgi:hypothetical protein
MTNAANLAAFAAGPTFSANNNASTQSVSSGTYTQVQFPTKAWDTGTCYNNTGSTVTLNGLSVPAYAFCPNVAGYYQFNTNLAIYGATVGKASAVFYKNGAGNGYGVPGFFQTTYSGEPFVAMSNLIYLNGTGDYVQVYVYQNSGSTCTIDYGSGYTFFNGALVSSA